MFSSPPGTPRKGCISSKKSAVDTLATVSPNRSCNRKFSGAQKLYIDTDNSPVKDGAGRGHFASPRNDCTLDRFIPNRKDMDFDAINNVLMDHINDENATDQKANAAPLTPNQNKYTKRIGQLVPRSPGERILSFSSAKKQFSPMADSKRAMPDFLDTPCSSPSSALGPRSLPVGPSRILDAPDLMDDYYLNLLSWSKHNVIAVALKNSVYLWNASDGSIEQLCQLEGEDDCITSVKWSDKDNTLALGTNTNVVELWDTAKSVRIRQMSGHSSRVSSLSWNSSLLSSGGRDSVILNHDTRQRNHLQFKYAGHEQEVCGLEWSPDGSTLASGGNDNLLCLWDVAMSTRNSQVSTYNPRIAISQHQAAVKALAWCPFQRNTLASGGGTADRTIRIWNTSSGANLKSVDTGSQVCAIQWSDTYKELVSSHGFSDNQLCLWRYPSMTKVREFRGHNSRVLHMSLSPDGSTIVSAGADETIRFWEIFGSSGAQGGGRSAPSSPCFKPGGYYKTNSSVSSGISGGLSMR